MIVYLLQYVEHNGKLRINGIYQNYGNANMAYEELKKENFIAYVYKPIPMNVIE